MMGHFIVREPPLRRNSEILSRQKCGNRGGWFGPRASSIMMRRRKKTNNTALKTLSSTLDLITNNPNANPNANPDPDPNTDPNPAHKTLSGKKTDALCVRRVVPALML